MSEVAIGFDKQSRIIQSEVQNQEYNEDFEEFIEISHHENENKQKITLNQQITQKVLQTSSDISNKNKMMNDREQQKKLIFSYGQKNQNPQNLDENNSKKSTHNEISMKKSDEDKQSKIKETINKFTESILVSKQSIVEDILSINKFRQINEKQIKNVQIFEKKIKTQIKLHENLPKNQKIKKQNFNLIVANQNQIQQQKSKNVENSRKKKKQIFLLQKKQRKQQKLSQKNENKIRNNQIQKRVEYENKFKSRRPILQDIPLSKQEIQQFEQNFIKKIKQRLRMGQIKSLKKIQGSGKQKIYNQKQERIKILNKKMTKNEKLKQKLLINLKRKLEDKPQHTQKSILLNDSFIQSPQTLAKKRTHQSAPQLKLPYINNFAPNRAHFASSLRSGTNIFQKLEDQ